MSEPKRAWLEDEENEVDERPPPALRVPADPGWRLVWMIVRERRSDVRALHCEVAISVAAITFWGLEAPIVVPGIPGTDPEHTLGRPAVLLPLHGDDGHRLPKRVRVFVIAPPTDARTDDQLIAACSEYLKKAEQLG